LIDRYKEIIVPGFDIFLEAFMVRLRKSFYALLILSFLVSLLGPATAGSVQVQTRVHPLLLETAKETPDVIVSVILQKSGESHQINAYIDHLGGIVTHDLRIINAIAVEIPASQLTKLAQHPEVGFISPDSVVEPATTHDWWNQVDLASTYVQAIRADQVWEENPDLQGNDITVAIVDSGIKYNFDLTEENNIRHARIDGYSSQRNSDGYGHGTHVAGIIGGNGLMSGGAYIGVAPGVHFLDVMVTDHKGAAATSDIIVGLQWTFDHKDDYNIRVVNFSMNSSISESYNTSPLNAALEILWLNGIVVVVSAGNNGSGDNIGVLYPPANDPFFITVGAAEDQGTIDISDDVLASFSAYGTTSDGFSKPDIVAPGKDIISILARWRVVLAREHPDHIVDRNYFRMSGTSMAAAVTSGAAALLLQDEPGLTPDQVKYRLMDTARPFNYGNNAGYLDIYAAVHGSSTEAANQEAIPHQLLAKMALIAYWASQNGEEDIDWENVDWSSVNWSSVNWSSVNWSSVNWSSVNWSSVNWSSVNWSSVNWSSVNWSSVNWSSVNWSSVNWSSVNWGSVNWASVYWEEEVTR
jgi:serine protease AprX